MKEFSAEPWPHYAGLPDEVLLAQCDLTKGRSSGPGGQHRNKVETKVTLAHTPTGVIAQASERRSVEDNKRMALKRLRLLLAVNVRKDVPVGEVGSELWKRRRQAPRPARAEELIPGVKLRPATPSGGRIVCSPDHHDYPALLAEAMDVIASCGWDVRRAATRLEVSPTQLVKLVKDHPPALLKLNEERVERGEHTLK